MPNLIVILQRLFNFLCIAGLLFFGGCAGSAVFVPSVRGSSQQEKPDSSAKPAKKKPVSKAKPASEKKKASAEEELDFAIAFADTTDKQLPAKSRVPISPIIDNKRKRRPKQLQVFSVPSSKVRVALYQNVNRIVLYSLGTVNVRAGRKSGKLSCRGRIVVTSRKKKDTKKSITGNIIE